MNISLIFLTLIAHPHHKIQNFLKIPIQLHLFELSSSCIACSVTSEIPIQLPLSLKIAVDSAKFIATTYQRELHKPHNQYLQNVFCFCFCLFNQNICKEIVLSACN